MEQAREPLKKLNVFAEKAARMGLFCEAGWLPASANRVWSERHESFVFRLHPASGARRSSAATAIFGLLQIISSTFAIALSFIHPRVALWAPALNFTASLIRKWSRRATVLD
jgi:hypothetical protein